MLVSQPENVRYLSGFSTPKDGQVLLGSNGALLVTDGRYTVQAQEESRIPVHIVGQDGKNRAQEQLDLYKAWFTGQVGYEAHHLTVSALRNLQENAPANYVPTTGLIEGWRTVKSAAEAAHIRQAAALADKGFSHILGFIQAGLSEIEVALELEFFLRKQGAEGLAFDLAVVSGPRSAMPHGSPSGRRLQEGDLVTLDFGVKIGGYCSDMTRTIGIGQVSAAHRAMYEAVLAAEDTALQAVAPGRSGHDLDSMARNLLHSRGYGPYFSHSLGHGVGLAIHEGPFLRQNSTEVLQAGHIITIEPGVYIPGDAGVRIEDLVLVTDGGYEVLSHSPKEFISR